MAYLRYYQLQAAVMDKKVIPRKALQQWLAMIWKDDREAQQAAKVIQAIWEALSP